jgi:hypothetical protein
MNISVERKGVLVVNENGEKIGGGLVRGRLSEGL